MYPGDVCISASSLLRRVVCAGLAVAVGLLYISLHFWLFSICASLSWSPCCVPFSYPYRSVLHAFKQANSHFPLGRTLCMICLFTVKCLCHLLHCCMCETFFLFYLQCVATCLAYIVLCIPFCNFLKFCFQLLSTYIFFFFILCPVLCPMSWNWAFSLANIVTN